MEGSQMLSHIQNAISTVLFSKYINKGLDMKAILFMARF